MDQLGPFFDRNLFILKEHLKQNGKLDPFLSLARVRSVS
jgi:hypothetical protein